MNVRELRDRRATMLESAQALVEAAETEDRDLTTEEQAQYDELISKADQLEQRISRLESLPKVADRQAPAVNRTRLGDDEIRAMSHYIKTGDTGAVRGLTGRDEDGKVEVNVRMPSAPEMRAVTDSTMNITTAADGKNIVPTGFAGQIAMRRNEIRLAERLGVRPVPGVGTTVNFPYENADAQEFGTTNEQADAHNQNYQRDAMQFGVKPFTLVKKTKKVELTEELLDDEDANLMAFVADNIGRALGVTHNKALITEVGTAGTKLVDFASATAIAGGEPEDIVYQDALGYYLDDGGSVAFVMRPSTYGDIASLTGNARLYAAQAAGQLNRELLGYPVFYSNQAAAIAAEAKSVYFGNWYYVGMREDPVLRIIRDPYSVDGLVILKYTTRLCYGVLIAGAIGYGAHPAAGS